MKKIIMIALAALPVFAMAQDKKEAPQAATTSTKTNDKPVLTNPEAIFIELVITQGPVGSMIKADVGREVIASLTDKELVKQLGDIRSMQFNNMPDAMNYLSSNGYKYQNTYVTYDKDNKPETHIVFEKRLMKRPSSDGGAKPGKPERPATEMKPADNTKPADKKPTPKPEEKKK